MPNKNYASTRYSTLDGINTENVKNLKVAWTFSTGVLRGHEGGPLVIGSTMYVHTPFPDIVYALDLTKEGAPVKWKYVPKQDAQVIPVACCDTVNRGLAYADGKIFLNQLDTNTVALDAETGKELWKVKQGDYKNGQTITSAPMVIKDKVISGISGGEFGVRGFVTANDVNTGKQVWRMYSTGPEAEVGFPGSVETWKGDEWKRGGGTTWGWYSYDPELNLFYYGTGNPGSWNPDQRPGDNKWSMTIFARNPDTGKATWAYQKTPHDRWDYDGINENVLVDHQHQRADAKGAGELRSQRLLVHAGSGNRRTADGRTVRQRELGEGRRPEDRQADRESREADVGDEEHEGHLSVGDGRQEPAAGRVLAEHRSLLRADQQPLHGLRRRRGEVPGRPAVRRRDRREPSRPGRQPR